MKRIKKKKRKNKECAWIRKEKLDQEDEYGVTVLQPVITALHELKMAFTVWSQLAYALLTHFDIMMDRFKNAFLVTSSVCRAEGPTGGRPPAGRHHVLGRSTTPDYL
jgi:hypothetical protein